MHWFEASGSRCNIHYHLMAERNGIGKMGSRKCQSEPGSSNPKADEVPMEACMEHEVPIGSPKVCGCWKAKSLISQITPVPPNTLQKQGAYPGKPQREHLRVEAWKPSDLFQI